MRALIISGDGFEDSELLVPYYRLKEERIEVDVASMKKGEIKGKQGYQVKVDKTLEEVKRIHDEDVLLLAEHCTHQQGWLLGVWWRDLGNQKNPFEARKSDISRIRSPSGN